MAHRVAPLGNIGEDEEVEGEDPEESKEMARLELGADASPLPSQTPRSVRTKLSSDLMKHALNKARHNKTGMEYSPTRGEASPAKPAAMDDLTTEHGELVLKANRGTVVIERRLPPVLVEERHTLGRGGTAISCMIRPTSAGSPGAQNSRLVR